MYRELLTSAYTAFNIETSNGPWRHTPEIGATPKQIIVSVYGIDASPRATAKLPCTDGRTTTTDHMPAPPMVDRRSATARRTHA